MFVDELRNNSEWEGFLQTSPDGTFYHSLKWKEVIQRSFPHSPLYLTLRDENGRLIGICPGFITDLMHIKVYNSIPYSDYGGPLVKEPCIEKASLSLQNFLQRFCLKKGIAYAKICFMDGKLAQFFKSSLSYEDKSVGIMEIDLKTTPSDFIWNKIFSKNLRHNIRRLERDGFQAQEAQTKSDLRDFYSLYYKNMKYIGGSLYSYEFMENIWKTLYPDNLRIWLVGKEKRIGGIVVFKYRQKAYWAYAGIDRSQNYSPYSVVPYLIWKEIKKAEEEGYRCVSLGATSSDSRNPKHLQKVSLGGSFYQQKVLWHPFDFTGHALLQTRANVISFWKTFRNFLPHNLKHFLESKLSKF
jgi:predicted N-acyltransferase